MQLAVLDFETYFDSRYYTLKKMTTEAYLRDRRFEVHGVSLRFGERDNDALWYGGEEARAWLYAIDWPNTAIICHHAHFDAGILAFHYGIRPRLIIDTLSMARALVGNHIKVGLDSLAKHYGLQAKTVPYNLFDGKHWHELTGPVQYSVAAGCCHDVNLTWDIFQRLAAEFPAEEYAMVDATVRMFTEPVLVGNTSKLAEIWSVEEQERRELLEQLRVSGGDIRSDETFAALLRAEGIEPETKTTAKGNKKYAFAKTDQFMRDLLESEENRVQALASARLDQKSNIVQTRSGRLGAMSTRGAMCVYLAPHAAHTTRWGGGDKLNWQNFPRESALGETIEAPPGSSCVVVDASQIECRLLNYMAGQWDVIERFARKQDPYISIASMFYGHEVYKPKPDDPRFAEMEQKRGTGKQLELSCGYGAGGPTIQATAAKGTYGPPVQITIEDAMRARDLYRDTHPAVTALWEASNDVLKNIQRGFDFDWLVFKIRNKRLYLPNGLFLNYESLHWRNEEREEINEWQGDTWVTTGVGEVTKPKGWYLNTRKGTVKMYGAKLVENFIQALSACHIRLAWQECLRAGIKIVSMEHDKLIACESREKPGLTLDFMRHVMQQPPPWAPGIPLDSEGYVSRTFKREK